MSTLGLFLILFAALNYSKETLFPGFNAFLPCFGAVLIIIFSEKKDDIVGKILSTKPITFIGKISYPAYLWHWPIIAFLNIYTIKINLIIGIFVIFITFVLSFLTYRYIELQAKKLNKYSIKKIIIYGFLIPTISLTSISSYAKKQGGWPQRFPENLNIKNQALLSYSNKLRGRCNEGSPASPLSEDKCILGINNKEVDFLLIGDSHANHFSGMIDILAKHANLRGYDITQSNTIYLPDTKSFYQLDSNRIEYTNFEIRNKALTNLINNKKYKAIILAGAYSDHLNNGDFESPDSIEAETIFKEQFKKSIIKIKNSGAIAILIKGNPILKNTNYDCTLINDRFNKHEKCFLDIKIHEDYFNNWEKFIDELKLEFPDLIIIDPTKIMCSSKECHTEINGIPLYRDNGHLNHMGSELIGRLYLEHFGNPLSILTSN